MRLAGARQVDWQDRRHFLAVAARTMRQVLVDLAAHKTRRNAVHKSPMSRWTPGWRWAVRPTWICALDEALETLATFDARKVRVMSSGFLPA